MSYTYPHTKLTPRNLDVREALFFLLQAPFSNPKAVAAHIAWTVQSGNVSAEHDAPLASLTRDVEARNISVLRRNDQWCAVPSGQPAPWVVTGDTWFLAAARAVIADAFGPDTTLHTHPNLYASPSLQRALRIAPLPPGVNPGAWSALFSLMRTTRLYSKTPAVMQYHATVVTSPDDGRDLPAGTVVVQYQEAVRNKPLSEAPSQVKELALCPNATEPMAPDAVAAHYGKVGFSPVPAVSGSPNVLHVFEPVSTTLRVGDGKTAVVTETPADVRRRYDHT